jgi:hypothetical protein
MTDDIDALEPLCDELMEWAQAKVDDGWRQQQALSAIVIVAEAIRAEITRAMQ